MSTINQEGIFIAFININLSSVPFPPRKNANIPLQLDKKESRRIAYHRIVSFFFFGIKSTKLLIYFEREYYLFRFEIP